MNLIKGLVPKYFLKNPLFLDFAEAVAGPLQSWYEIVQKLHLYIDPNNAPVSWLNPLMFLVGLPRKDDLTPSLKKALIAGAFSWWILKGTEGTIEEYLSAYLSATVDVVRLNTTSFIVGVNTAGDVIGALGGTAWHYEIHIPNTVSQTDVQIKQILLPFSAAYESYDIVRV